MKYLTERNLLDQYGILCHQVNCLGVMGAGLAKQISQKYPDSCKKYISKCHLDEFALGSLVIEGTLDMERKIAHVGGQKLLGPNTDYSGVALAFDKLTYYIDGATSAGFTYQVYIPFMMGCGIGGGNWKKYLEIVSYYIPEVNVVVRKEDMATYMLDFAE